MVVAYSVVFRRLLGGTEEYHETPWDSLPADIQVLDLRGASGSDSDVAEDVSLMECYTVSTDKQRRFGSSSGFSSSGKVNSSGFR